MKPISQSQSIIQRDTLLTSHKPHELLYVHSPALLFIEAQSKSSSVRVGQIDITRFHRLKMKKKVE